MVTVPVSLARWCWCAPLVFFKRDFWPLGGLNVGMLCLLYFLIRHGTLDTPILGIWSGGRSGLRYRLEGICIDSNCISLA